MNKEAAWSSSQIITHRIEKYGYLPECFPLDEQQRNTDSIVSAIDWVLNESRVYVPIRKDDGVCAAILAGGFGRRDPTIGAHPLSDVDVALFGAGQEKAYNCTVIFRSLLQQELDRIGLHHEVSPQGMLTMEDMEEIAAGTFWYTANGYYVINAR